MKSMIVFFALVAVAFSSPIAQQSNSLIIGGNSGKNQVTAASITHNQNSNGAQTGFITLFHNKAQKGQHSVLSTAGNVAGDQVFESFATLNTADTQGTALVQSGNTAKNTQKGSSKISNSVANEQENIVLSNKNSATTATTKADVTNNLSMKTQSNFVSVNDNRATKQVLGSGISGNVAGQQTNEIENARNAAKGDQTFDVNLNKNIVFTGKQGKQVNSGAVSDNTAGGNQKVNSDLTGNQIMAKDCSSAKTPQEVLDCLGL